MTANSRDDFTKIVAGADRPRSSGGAPKKYVGASSIWVLIFGMVGKFESMRASTHPKMGG